MTIVACSIACDDAPTRPERSGSITWMRSIRTAPFCGAVRTFYGFLERDFAPAEDKRQFKVIGGVDLVNSRPTLLYDTFSPANPAETETTDPP